uniref:Ribosome biogenesis protein BRX1 homolog n=1 Tax=Cyprinus carpio carpio TaxID=630221 RepID=A0A8C1HFW8_CYPCA
RERWRRAEGNVQRKDARGDSETKIISGKWRSKERVLVFCSRGISFRTMMPHNTKMDRKDQLFVVNEVCEIKNCYTCIFSEAKQQQDLNMISNAPHGPSRRWCVFVVHTLAELKMTGNCLKGSRPLLSFDPKEPHHALLKELFTQVYFKSVCVCVCVIVCFSACPQITEEDVSLVEIGPRFVLNLIIIFQGSLGGPTLCENPHFLSLNTASTLSCTRCSCTPDVTEDVFLTPAEPKQLRLTELKKKTRMKHKGLR